MNYGPELILRLKNHFKNKYAKDLTDEEANQYLESYANLYLLVTKNKNYESQE